MIGEGHAYDKDKGHVKESTIGREDEELVGTAEFHVSMVI